MNFDAITISLIALVISFISFLIALYNSHVDRLIQIEQLKGEMVTRLTYRGLEILTHIKEIKTKPSEETVELLDDFIKVAEGIVNIRQRLKKFPKLPYIGGSAIIPELHSLRNDIVDAEAIFEKLNEAINNWDLLEMRESINGLLERL
ncbi:MAG: hypothetical protein U9P73_05220 [Candidatus Cloacimonadota bacterium]|nr:hypothetical protein [Candidatus Cloacimonadota bacterium]